MISYADPPRGGVALPEQVLSCVVSVDPRDPEAFRLQEELSRRYPHDRISTFSSPSGISFVDLFIRE